MMSPSIEVGQVVVREGAWGQRKLHWLHLAAGIEEGP
jgi:hypothetical protein